MTDDFNDNEARIHRVTARDAAGNVTALEPWPLGIPPSALIPSDGGARQMGEDEALPEGARCAQAGCKAMRGYYRDFCAEHDHEDEEES